MEHVIFFVDAAITLVGGAFGTLMGYQVIGDRMLANEKYSKFLVKSLPVLKISGPIMLCWGAYLIVKAVNSLP